MKPIALTLLLLSAASPAQAADFPIVPPIGALSLCQRVPAMCVRSAPASADAGQRALVERINLLVNSGAAPTPDPLAPDGRRDRWDLALPTRAADCEDFALTKMFLLAWAGVPMGAMRIAIVHADWLADGDNHAVLLVRIGGVEYIADNRDARLRRAADVSYRWLKAAHEGDMLMWTALFEAPL